MRGRKRYKTGRWYGATRIFINAKGTVEGINQDLKAFLHYVNGVKEDNDFVDEVKREVERLKNNDDWRMCPYDPSYARRTLIGIL